MIRGDYHVHTSFCDGSCPPEEMVRAALEKGMDAIGFSGHSHTAFDESWCMSPAGTEAYRAEIARPAWSRICIPTRPRRTMTM